MDTATLLRKSLDRLNERVQDLDEDEDLEFQDVGDAVMRIQETASEESVTFIENLVTLSKAVIKVRTRSKGRLRDLPVTPYDLWLPFKAKGSTLREPIYDADVIKVFNEEINDIASRWRPIAARLRRRTEPKPIDQDLLNLRDRILDQYNYCNNCSSGAIKGLRIFKAPEESGTTELSGATELFVRILPIPVTCPADFKVFIGSLHQVFYESLKNFKASVSNHPDPARFTNAMEIINGEAFKSLNVLRNKWSHADSNAAQTLAPIYEKLVGVTAIERDNATAWLTLQKAILKMLAGTLDSLALSLPKTTSSKQSP